MIDTCVVDNDLVYEISNKHFTNIGLPLIPAKGTPLKLSYIWKHVKRLTAKFIEWDFTPEEIDLYMQIVADRIRRLPHRQQSLQNAIKTDMMEFCYNELKRLSDTEDDLMAKFRNMHEWLAATAGRDFDAQVSHLTRRHKPGAAPNIIVYYQQGRLNKQYIAFSAACRRALAIIGSHNPVERSLCPNDAALQFITHYKYKQQASTIKSILE